MAAEDGLKAQKLLAQGVWMQNTLFFQGVLDVTYAPSPSENGRLGVYHRGQNRYHDST